MSYPSLGAIGFGQRRKPLQSTKCLRQNHLWVVGCKWKLPAPDADRSTAAGRVVRYFIIELLITRIFPVSNFCLNLQCNYLNNFFMSTVEFNQMLVNNAEFLKPFAITLTRDSEAAKDLFQETLFRALANKDKYSVGTNIKAWLYTIMRNIFINNYRRKVKQNTIFDSTPNDFLINQTQSVVANNAESNLRLKDIQEAIHNLPQIFRNPFLLYFDGFKYHEIADMLGEPLGTIKSRIHFARKLLKTQIERH